MLKKFIRFISALAGIGFTCLALGLLAAALVIYHYSQELPDYAQLAHYDPDTVTRLYAQDGKLLAEYAVEKRIYVPLSSVPKRVIQAFISAEDKTFYTNAGIDFYGIARALRQDWRNLTSRNRSLAGGSTITQQVVKNFLLTNEQSLPRKIKEAILAFRITKVYSKDRILELYLNEIYLGKGSYGVAAASLNYFDKSLDELTIEEAALLAAMPKAPAEFNPARFYDKAKGRRDAIINAMMDQGYITADEARAAIAKPIVLRARDKTEMASADFFAEEVRRELATKYGDDTLYKGGLFVKTTLDPRLQHYADEALRYALTQYDHRKGFRGPVTHFADTANWRDQLAALIAKNRVPLFDSQQLAMVEETNSERTVLGFVDGKRGTIDKTSVAWVAHKGLSVGDVVIAEPSTEEEPKEKPKRHKGKEAAKPVEKKKDVYALTQIPLVNGAMIALDPHTGRVLAMSGGYSYGGTEFNRATQAKRQPGSSFKPFVYLTAMENGFTPSSIVLDAPVELSQGNGMPVWRPNNYSDEGFLGPATLRVGLEKSRNAMTVRLSQALGIDKIIEVAKRFGIYDKLPEEYSIVLGAQETTLIRLANAYCMIDNGGKKVSPSLIERIDDKYGKTIFRRDTRDCKGCDVASLPSTIPDMPPLPADNRAQIVDPRVAYQMVSMLEGVVQFGTGSRARILGRPIAGKTGTTNESKDTWFIGFSPNLVAGIYVGYDQPQSLGKRETGASVALPGFIYFMQKALDGVPSTPFRIPPGIDFIKVDAKTGQPPLPGDSDPVIMEAFKDGEGPDTGNTTPPPEGYQGIDPAYEFPSENPAPPGAQPVFAAPVPPQPQTYQPAPATPPDNQGTGGLY
jgi:penicillin-binding protein 1A